MACPLFSDIHDLLYNAKLVLFDLQNDWQGVEPFEKQLHLNAKAFKGNKQTGTDLLKGILAEEEEEEDEDLADKKPEAAFILASIATEAGKELEFLFELWEEHEELSSIMKQALKYTGNPFALEWIQTTFGAYSQDIQAELIEILEFHQQVDSKNWDINLETQAPKVSEKIYRTHANSGISVDKADSEPLWQDPESEIFEETLFSELISGNENALLSCRRRLIEAPDKTTKLAIYLACAAGNKDDLLIIRRCILEEEIRTTIISSLGILGLPLGVSTLIEMIDDQITSKDHWDQQWHILDSLNLITGADLPLLLPEIKEGPEDKKHEIKVEIDWKNQWLSWWIENQHNFNTDLRYRRGAPFTMESCIAEMAFQRGNYWSRQFSYYELQIRSGKHIAPFFADWNVKDQFQSIEKWQHWWQENKHTFEQSQWLFNGKNQ